MKIYIIKELRTTTEISMYQHCCELIFYNDALGEADYYMEKDYNQGGGHEHEVDYYMEKNYNQGGGPEQIEGLLISR